MTNDYSVTHTEKLEQQNTKTKIKLKKLKDQVIVITGASSGIGLVTARMAAEKGAKVVAAARNEDALKELADELKEKGTTPYGSKRMSEKKKTSTASQKPQSAHLAALTHGSTMPPSRSSDTLWTSPSKT